MQRRRAVVFLVWKKFQKLGKLALVSLSGFAPFFCGFASENSCIEIFVWLADQSWRTICNSEGRNN
jgi:hypothetical protein